MTIDLSTRHELVGDLFRLPKTCAEWDRYKLSDEQVAFYHEQGYLAGVRILTDEQIAKLRAELVEFFDPQHPGHELWYEYHTNESTKPDTVLFHALGAWRIRPGFHDVLWHPAFTVAGEPAARRRGPLLARSALLQAGASMAASSPGIRTIPIGRAPSRWPI